MASHNVIDYMKKCETRIGEEVSRSNNYLEERTKKPLLEVLNAALIENMPMKCMINSLYY